MNQHTQSGSVRALRGPTTAIGTDSRAGSSGVSRREVVRWRQGGASRRTRDWLAREEPLEIRVRGRGVAVTMRTPGHDAELAAGFLVSEGMIRHRAEVVRIAVCQRGVERDNILNLFLAPSVKVDFERLTRHVFATSSCGVCGKSSIEAVHQHFPPIDANLTVTASELLKLPRRLREGQKAFDQTGGLHAAAIFDLRGRRVVLREDVGRHNAVDKVIGFGLLRNRLPFRRHVLMVSGRASFEIMQKALAAGIPIVCSVSAPSSLAVEFAEECGQTLAGFVRGESLNVYSRPERIRFQAPSMRSPAEAASLRR